MPSLKEYDSDGHLSAGDVALDSQTDPTVVRVHIKESKTDPFRKGVDVYLGDWLSFSQESLRQLYN